MGKISTSFCSWRNSCKKNVYFSLPITTAGTVWVLMDICQVIDKIWLDHNFYLFDFHFHSQPLANSPKFYFNSLYILYILFSIWLANRHQKRKDFKRITKSTFSLLQSGFWITTSQAAMGMKYFLGTVQLIFLNYS